MLGLGVGDEIGDLGGPVVGVDRDRGGPDAAEREPVEHMLGPVVEEERDTMAEPETGRAVAFGEPVDLVLGSGIGELQPLPEVGAALPPRHAQERCLGMGHDGAPPDLLHSLVVVQIRHGLLRVATRRSWSEPGDPVKRRLDGVPALNGDQPHAPVACSGCAGASLRVTAN